MSGYLVQKRERFERLMRGEITVEEYVAQVKAEVAELIRRMREHARDPQEGA